MYNQVITNLKEGIKKSINHYNSQLATVRAGRANPRMVDKVMVNYYGNPTPLNQMANISVPEARMLVISLWDVSMLKEVLKAINQANLGLTPSDDGKVVRLTLPVLTEERRKEYVKTAKTMTENAKIACRTARQDAMNNLKNLKKDNELTEDDVKTGEKEVQKLIDEANKEIDELYRAKEKDILSV